MRLRNPGLPDWINDHNAQILGDAHDTGDVKIEKRIHVSRRREMRATLDTRTHDSHRTLRVAFFA